MDIPSLQAYQKMFPHLPMELLLYFSNKKNNKKDLTSFLGFYKEKYKPEKFPQPFEVAKIAEILMNHRQLSILGSSGMDYLSNRYFCHFDNRELVENNIEQFKIFSESYDLVVYGFPYIYKCYKKYILPIEHELTDGTKTIGTGFLYMGGIATAKHCLEGAKSLSIKGINPELLNSSEIWIDKNPNMDLAFIDIKIDERDSIIRTDEAKILDKVLTLGFPIIPGFHSFMTAEKANISARYTSTKGTLAARGCDIFSKKELLLITARIKGGNSGGPLINSFGRVVGITTQEPVGDGRYDELGYGTAIPIENLTEIMNKKEKRLEKCFFCEFPED